MEHQATLLVTIVMGFVMAFALGFVASKLKLPPLVGYLVAGIVIGPFTPGMTADVEVARQLAEIGIILLMFGVGLHFSTADLLAVRGIAIPGAIAQIGVATLIGLALTSMWGWSLGGGLVMGFALSVASTVVVLRALEERSALDTVNGRISIAWLVVEDLATVFALVLLPTLAGILGGTPTGDAHGAADAGDGNILLLLAVTLAKIFAFLAIAFVLGPRVVPWILRQAARTGSRELFTLSVLAVALGIAFGAAALFGISFALGAFCAGVVLSNSSLSQRAAAESLPLQNAFAVLFFVSVGMLFDPTILVRDPLAVLAVLGIILIGKSLAAFAIVVAMGYPVSTGLTVSACLAQIGEFSFILAGLAIALGLMPPEGRDLILAGALLSITLNPLAFAAVEPATRFVHRALATIGRPERDPNPKIVALEKVLAETKKHHTPVGLEPEELISRFNIFATLTPEQRERLLSLFKPRQAMPGERLIRAGDKAEEIFFISSGAVEVSVAGRAIKLGPGDFFGEMALLSGAPRSADVTAIDYCQLLALGREDFQRFIANEPALKERLRQVAIERAAMNQRERDMHLSLGG
jgi:CPA2 family monovalent cation:H+ antiporter-2